MSDKTDNHCGCVSEVQSHYEIPSGTWSVTDRSACKYAALEQERDALRATSVQLTAVSGDNVSEAKPLVCAGCGSWTLVYRCTKHDSGDWRCHKQDGHTGECSPHMDCGQMSPEKVVCSFRPEHDGLHSWQIAALEAQLKHASRESDLVEAATTLGIRKYWCGKCGQTFRRFRQFSKHWGHNHRDSGDPKFSELQYTKADVDQSNGKLQLDGVTQKLAEIWIRYNKCCNERQTLGRRLAALEAQLREAREYQELLLQQIEDHIKSQELARLRSQS